MKDITTQLAESSNALGFDIWSRVRSTVGNLTLSPISVSSALAMTYGGARGHTATEMAKVMHVDHIDADVMVEFGKILASLQQSTDVNLRVANRLFGEQHFLFHQQYLDQTNEAFGAPLEAVDFRENPDSVRTHINEWVASHTQNLIRDLLPSGSIDGTTRLVLTNAIYFLANWAVKFNKKLSYDSPFRLINGDTASVKMMNRASRQNYGKVDDVQILELPYNGENLSMLIALPKDDDIAKLERSLSQDRLTSWRRAMFPKKVEIHLPRFKLDPSGSMNLSNALNDLGMEDAFDTTADFTGMAPTQGKEALHIDSVFHKTFVKTDEDGTEAAAATAVSMSRSMSMSMDEDTPVFRADHPFVFLIQDEVSGAVLFMGRVADPSKS